MKERLGIFGGTFNPIHFGHLRAAVEVMENFSLDRIVFVPSAQPPHKNYTNIASAADRYEMTQLAIRSYSRFECSNIEIQRKGLSYTIDTIKEFQSSYSSNVQLFYLIGWDAFMAIHTWKSFERLFSEIPFIVMSRPDENHSMPYSIMVLRKLVPYVQLAVSQGYCLLEADCRLVHKEKQTIYYSEVTALDISATQIRALIHQQKSTHFLLPDPVESYIRDRRIYN